MMTARPPMRLIYPALCSIVIAIVLMTPAMDGWTPAAILAIALPVIVLGVPHGALDPLIARHFGLWEGRWGLVLFLCAYLGLACLTVAPWLMAPGPMLVGFLLISVLHFSGDWRAEAGALPALGAAAGLIILPAWQHESEVAAIFAALTGDGSGVVIASAMHGLALPVLAVAVAGLVAAMMRARMAGLEILATLAAATVLPPLVFFALYFCALHSPRHLARALKQIGPELRGHAPVCALAIMAATLALAVVAWPWLAGGTIAADSLRLVFIGLAALTVPHMLLVDLAAWRAGRAGQAGRTASKD